MRRAQSVTHAKIRFLLACVDDDRSDVDGEDGKSHPRPWPISTNRNAPGIAEKRSKPVFSATVSMGAVDEETKFLGRAFVEEDFHAAREGSALFAAKSNTA